MYVHTNSQPQTMDLAASTTSSVSVRSTLMLTLRRGIYCQRKVSCLSTLIMPTCSRWLAPYEIHSRTSHLRIFHQPFQVTPALPVPTVSMSLLAVPLQVSLLTSLLSFNRQCSTKTFLTLKTPPCSHSQITSFSTTFTPSPSR